MKNRNLLIIIESIIESMPFELDNLAQELDSELYDIKNGIAYRAPENLKDYWMKLHLILKKYIPTLTEDWHFTVISIYSGIEESVIRNAPEKW